MTPCLRCLRVSRGHVPYMPPFIRTFASYVPYFLGAFRAFIFLRASRALILYVPYVPSLFTCLTCLYFFACLHFFMFLHVIYVLIKLYSSMIFAIIEFSYLSTFIKYFHFYKTRFIFCMIFSFFETTF